MMKSCLVDPVGAEVANQSNSGLQHSSTLGAWVCRAGWGAGGRVKSRFVSSAFFLSLRDPVCFCSSCSGVNHTAPQGSILGTDFPGTMYCYLMLKIIRKNVVWKWFSLLAWRLCTVHNLLTCIMIARRLAPQPCIPLACYLGWFIVGPTLSSWVFQMQRWLWRVCCWLTRQCWLLWRGCLPCRWKNR